MIRNIGRLILVLFLGQVVSFSLAIAGFAASFIALQGADTPLTQSLFSYIALAIAYGAILLYRRKKLLAPWYWYVGLAFVDVQGNYLVVKAYQYSSITSVTLLNCWTIPWVIMLTWLVFGTRYSLWQLFGAAICVVGLVLVMFSDSGIAGGGGNKPLLGDVLVIAGTLCYAISNVGEEFCVKHEDQVEVVAMLGMFGVLFSAIQISIIEMKSLQGVNWTPTMISLFLGFAAATFVFHTVCPFVLKMSGSVLLNLSILTSNMWAVFIRIFFYHQKVDWLYYVAFGVVSIGLVIYSLNDESSNEDTRNDQEQVLTMQYERLIGESK
ncbi:hypothetical protein LUZ60_001756 [Juncus effusus]|nr:hypothetical protein LUZ60_001756 [Juncus effusus]